MVAANGGYHLYLPVAGRVDRPAPFRTISSSYRPSTNRGQLTRWDPRSDEGRCPGHVGPIPLRHPDEEDLRVTLPMACKGVGGARGGPACGIPSSGINVRGIKQGRLFLWRRRRHRL